MHYYTHNIGEFATKTRFMSPEEIGIYVILKDEYYANGMRIACDRIANLMPPECEASLKRVLRRFFVEKDGFYECAEFDAELSTYKDRGSVNAENAKKRWEKKRNASKTESVSTGSDAKVCESDATRIKSDANSCLTNNQEPITNNQVSKEKVEKENLELVNLVSEPAEPEKTKKATKSRKKPVTSCPFTSDDEIPSEYLALKDKYPEVDVIAEFATFVNFHTSKGNQFADWLAAFRNWLNKAKQYASERKSNVANRGFSKSQKTPGFGVLLESDPSDPSTYDQTAIDEVYRRSAERLDMANIDDTDVPF